MEIGSEFNFDYSSIVKCDDTIFQYLDTFNTIYTNSGRSALMLIKSICKKGTILLPNYTCESVIDCFRQDYKILFYDINSDLTINVESLYKKLDQFISVIYIQTYFGKSASIELVNMLSEAKLRYDFDIIEDTTHSIFTTPITCGDYCICSLRKWFPIPDGGVLYSKKSLLDIDIASLKQGDSCEKLNAMILKTMFLENKYDTNQQYRSMFTSAEHAFDLMEAPLLISDISMFILQCCSLHTLITRRKENYMYLHTKVTNKYIDKMPLYETNICPYTMIVHVDNRNHFRSYLIQNKIYCAVHWPLDKLLENFLQSKIFAEHLLSLPIDQRYTTNEMDYFSHILNQYEPDINIMLS